MRRLTFLILLPLLVCNAMKGQRAMSWEEFVEYLTENEEYAGEANWTDNLEELEVLYQHPVDINTASAEQLQSLPLLSQRQVTDILQYRDYHHGMHSLAELILLPSISYYERRYLPLFLYAGSHVKNIWNSPEISSQGHSYSPPNKDTIPNLQVSTQNNLNGYPLDSLQGHPTSTLKGHPTSSHKGHPASYLQLPKSTPWRDLLNQLHHEWGTRLDMPLYHRRGYLVENGYLGSSIYNKVYYRMEARHLSASLRGERDGGEKGIDSYGGHILLSDLPLLKATSARHDRLKLKTLVVGDFKASLGLGLVMRQGFIMGKQTGHLRQSMSIRPHRSTDETNFLRGVGLALQAGATDLSILYSHRKWDATLDSVWVTTGGLPTQTAVAKTIVDNGYHRTATELKKKHALDVDVVAGNLSWHYGNLHLGTTGYLMTTSKELQPGNEAYRKIYPQGRRFGSMGLDYSYEQYRWRLFGETAYGGSLQPTPLPENALSSSQGNPAAQEPRRKGLATLNGIEWRPSARYALSLMQRYYSYSYYSFFAGAISESGGVQNETGALIRLDASPWDAIHVASLVDFFYNPWPRYGLSQSSRGWNAMLEAQCNLSRRSTVTAKYDVKSKEQSTGQETHHRLRVQWQGSLAQERWRLSATAMLHCLKGSHGEALGSTLRYSPRGRWGLSASGLYFHTTDSKSRIYLYEPNVREMMYIPSFSGHGVRGSGVVQCQLWRERIGVELKYGVTRYLDRDQQGSGLQTIYSKVKNDITVQVRLRI